MVQLNSSFLQHSHMANTIHSMKTTVMGDGPSAIHGVMMALDITDAASASQFVQEAADQLKLAIMQSPMEQVKVLLSVQGAVMAQDVKNALLEKQKTDKLFMVMCMQIQGMDIIHIDASGKPLDAVTM